jgi:hypothetical protein
VQQNPSKLRNTFEQFTDKRQTPVSSHESLAKDI